MKLWDKGYSTDSFVEEFTVGRDFDDPEYCGFVFDAAHVADFLSEGQPHP